MGSSRTCFHVKYALTHWTFKIAAASITDGVDGGYLQYMVSIPSNYAIPDEFDKIYGGPPFGWTAEAWFSEAPAFNADKASTPTLVTAIGPLSVLYEWEWFAAMTRLHKPVEMRVIPEGTHILEKPSERMASQQTNVDWFLFWLKGEEDSDPATSEQYARWRELRKLQQQNETKHKEASSAPNH